MGADFVRFDLVAFATGPSDSGLAASSASSILDFATLASLVASGLLPSSPSFFAADLPVGVFCSVDSSEEDAFASFASFASEAVALSLLLSPSGFAASDAGVFVFGAGFGFLLSTTGAVASSVAPFPARIAAISGPWW